MNNYKTLLLMLFTAFWIQLPAFAQEDGVCTESDQQTQDQCEIDAISNCRQVNPLCLSHSTTIQTGVNRILRDCCKQGVLAKVRFTACKKRKARSIRSLKRAFPAQFTNEAVQTVRDLRFSQCSEEES